MLHPSKPFCVILFVAGCALIGPRAAIAADEHKHAAHYDACAKACADCMRVCDTCSRHCAEMILAGHKEHMQTLLTCTDCADVCASAGKIVARRGPYSAMICETCAKVCDDCCAACEKFPNDEHMKNCARECRDCAKACREMIKHLGQGTP